MNVNKFLDSALIIWCIVLGCYIFVAFVDQF